MEKTDTQAKTGNQYDDQDFELKDFQKWEEESSTLNVENEPWHLVIDSDDQDRKNADIDMLCKFWIKENDN